MTNYAPDLVSDSYDFYGSRALTQQKQQPRPAPNYQVSYSRDGLEADVTVTINDFSGGLDATSGNFPLTHNRFMFCTGLYVPGPGQLTLAPIMSSANAASITGNAGLHYANFGANGIALALGGAANSALFGRTSATDPTITAKTYTPSSSITGLWTGIIGGATTALQLFIGRESGAVQVASDFGATPTIAGTMDAATAGCFGMMQTPLNGNTWLGAFANLIHTTPQTAAIGDAWTATATPIREGGYALGILELPGVPISAYWFEPDVNVTTGALAAPFSNPGRILRTNLEGTDPQGFVPFGLKKVIASCAFGDGIVASDGQQIVWYRGEADPINLHWAWDRDTSIFLTNVPSHGWVRGFINYGSKLGVLEYSSTDVNASFQVTVYDPFKDAWSAQTIWSGLLGNPLLPAYPSGSYPYSTDTNVMYLARTLTGGGYTFHWQYNPDYGKSLHSTYRDMSGFGFTMNNFASFTGYESSGTLYSPKWYLPGITGWDQRVVAIGTEADLSSDTVSATGTPSLQVQAGGYFSTAAAGGSYTGGVSRTFYRTTRWVYQEEQVPNNTDTFTGPLQVAITGARGTDTDRTGNFLPIIIKIHATRPQGAPLAPSYSRPPGVYR